MAGISRWTRRAAAAGLLLVAVVAVPLAGAASAQQDAPDDARGFGATVEVNGTTVVPPTPEARALAPGDQELTAIGVPADPVVVNGTLIAKANAHPAADITSDLQAVQHDVPGPYSARGLGQIEHLRLVSRDGVPLLQADAVRAEAVATCEGGQARYSAASELVNLVIGGQQIPVNAPVEALVDALSGALQQTTLDRVAQVARNVVVPVPGGGASVSALVVTLLAAAGDEPAVRVVLGHGEVTGTTCVESATPGEQGVQVRKTPSATVVSPGRRFDYQITATNTSRGCTLRPARVVDTITGPAGSTVAATAPAATSVEGLTVTWDDVGPIGPGESVHLVITVEVPEGAADGATYADRVVLTGTCDGRELSDDDAVTGPRVAGPGTGPCRVTAAKDRSHVEVRAGGEFTYSVLVHNAGGETCRDLVVTDALDDRLAFVACTPVCTSTGQQVRFAVAELEPGGSLAFTMEVRVRDDATGELHNAALVAPGNGDAVEVEVRGPRITDRFVPAPIGPPGPRGAGAEPSEVQPSTTLPRTGGGPAAGLLLLVVGAAVLSGRWRTR